MDIINIQTVIIVALLSLMIGLVLGVSLAKPSIH